MSKPFVVGTESVTLHSDLRKVRWLWWQLDAKAVWIEILLAAVPEPTKVYFHGVEYSLQANQAVITQAVLAQRSGVGANDRVRTILRMLERRGWITREVIKCGDRTATLITITGTSQ